MSEITFRDDVGGTTPTYPFLVEPEEGGRHDEFGHQRNLFLELEGRGSEGEGCIFKHVELPYCLNGERSADMINCRSVF